MLSVVNLKARSLDVGEMELTWELGASGTEDALDYTIEVMRSESPSGPFDVISPPFEDRYIFIDRRVPVGSKFTVHHYMLRLTHKATGTSAQVGPVAQQAEADLIAQAIRRQEMTLFTQVIGRSCWLFKKRVFGPRCRTCWDAVLQKRTVERCLDCFGTGMLRGYHDPIEVFVQLDPSTKQQQNMPNQIAELVTTTARMSYYPNVQPGDLLIEAENRRWRVQAVTTSERLRAPIKQELSLRELEPKDIEFKLPLKLSRALRDIQPSPVRMFTNSTDIDSDMAVRDRQMFESFMTYPLDPEKGPR